MPKISNAEKSLSNGILTTNYSDNKEGVVSSPMNIKENSEILQTLEAFGAALGTSKGIKDINEIEKLQNLLKDSNSHLKFHIDDSRNLLTESNVIRRDTFIDNNYNKKLRVNEIQANSDMRIHKYGILFNFINSNIKEMADLVNKKSEDSSEIKDLRLEKPVLPRKMLTDLDASFVDDVSDADFLRSLADHSINCNIDNFSRDMSSMIRSNVIDISLQTNADKTQHQYSGIAEDDEQKTITEDKKYIYYLI